MPSQAELIENAHLDAFVEYNKKLDVFSKRLMFDTMLSQVRFLPVYLGVLKPIVLRNRSMAPIKVVRTGDVAHTMLMLSPSAPKHVFTPLGFNAAGNREYKVGSRPQWPLRRSFIYLLPVEKARVVGRVKRTSPVGGKSNTVLEQIIQSRSGILVRLQGRKAKYALFVRRKDYPSLGEPYNKYYSLVALGFETLGNMKTSLFMTSRVTNYARLERFLEKGVKRIAEEI